MSMKNFSSWPCIRRFVPLFGVFFLFHSLPVWSASGDSPKGETESLIGPLWDLVDRKPYFKDGTGEREAAAAQPKLYMHLCTAGDCQNGYGVAVGRTRSYYYRYEGTFLGGKFSGTGFMDRKGSSPIAGYWYNDDLVPGVMLEESWDVQRWVLKRTLGLSVYPLSKPKGFPLALVQAHQARAFTRAAGFVPLAATKCFVPAVLTRYLDTIQRNTVIAREKRGEDVGWTNDCKHKVYMRAIEKIEHDGSISYHDAPLVFDHEGFFTGALPVRNPKMDANGIYYLESYQRTD